MKRLFNLVLVLGTIVVGGCGSDSKEGPLQVQGGYGSDGAGGGVAGAPQGQAQGMANVVPSPDGK